MFDNVNTKADVVRAVLAFLGALKILLGAFNIEIPQELIDSIANLVGTIFVIVGIVKHNFFGKKGKEQKQVLQNNDLL